MGGEEMAGSDRRWARQVGGMAGVHGWAEAKAGDSCLSVTATIGGPSDTSLQHTLAGQSVTRLLTHFAIPSFARGKVRPDNRTAT